MTKGSAEAAIASIERDLADLDLTWSRSGPGLFSVSLPGTRKLITECALEVGLHGVGVRAFVARRSDENHEGVYRWLLQRNLKTYAVAFSLDALGDVYLTGRVSHAAIVDGGLDEILGSVADLADSSFNTILELGFADSIRREWAWRRSRGESTTNLEAFRHLDAGSPTTATSPTTI